MMNKKRAAQLENALKSEKNASERNNLAIQPLLEADELLTKHVHAAQEPRSEFKERLLASITSERSNRSNYMKLPKFSLPSFQLSMPMRWSAGVATVVLIAVVVSSTGLFPFGGSRIGGRNLGNFSRLIIDEAYAQDNFTIIATDGDTTGVNSASGFTITSHTDVSLEDLRNTIRIFPETPFTLSEVGANTFFLEPHTALQGGLVYTVGIDASFRSSAGQLQERDYSWAFQVKEPFKVMHTLPRNLSVGVPTNTGIEFTFSHQNVQGLKDAFSITPHVEGRFETHGRTAVFVPNTNLQASTIYRVTLADTVQVKGSEEKLLEPINFEFETSRASSRDYFGIQEPMLEFAAGDRVVIPVYANENNNKEISIKVHAFKSADQFASALREQSAIPVWAQATRRAHSIKATDLAVVSSSAANIQKADYRQFVLLPDELKAGLYLVELGDGSEASQVLIQVTDLAVYSAVTATDTIVWVNDVSTHEAVPDAKVTTLDGRFNTSTNAEGIALLDASAMHLNGQSPWNVNEYVTVAAGNKLTVVQIGKSTDYYYMDTEYTPDQYWDYFYTDRSMYQPTDTVSFWGFVQARSGSTPDTVRVTLASESYYNDAGETIPLYQENLSVVGGAFAGSTSFSRLTPGSYVLRVYQGETQIASRYLSVTEYEKPAYQLAIEADKKAGFATESFDYTVDASFFEGTPVSGLSLSAKSSNSLVATDQLTKTLDQNGQGTLTFDTRSKTCTYDNSCSLYAYGTVSIQPTLAEEADIVASTPQLVFNSRVSADISAQRSSSQMVTTMVKAFNVDLSKINNSAGRYYNVSDYRGSSAAGVQVRGQITEVSYSRVQTGEVYDFINKVHYPKYRYDKQEKIVHTFKDTTGLDGSFAVTYQGTEDKSYFVEIIVQDKFGGEHNLSEWAHADARFREWSEYDYYSIRRVQEADGFSLGEAAEFNFKKNNQPIVADTDDAFLFLKLQEGLIDHEVSQDALYSFIFNAEAIPSVVIDGVYFDGESYFVPGYSMGSSNARASLDLSNRELRITVSTDKDEYEPGEKVALSLSVTDANGKSVASAVNVNLVDEAFYALQEEAVNPLESLYRSVGTGLGSVSETHKYRSLSGLDSLAEGGGCFLPGTGILLEDGTEKYIQDIKVGDRILTKASERSDKLVGATVKQVFTHDVNEYMILNGQIRVTPIHRMFVNYGWQPIGEARVGDVLHGANGEMVPIKSIDWVREPVTVYNFEVEGLHTYIADGVYVHNDKGGVREDFADTALFESVITDGNGQASLSFELPDNITTWRVTAQAISPDLYAGVGVTPVRSTKPVFADAVIASEYLTSDKPEIKVRAYGTALTDDSELQFEVSSDSLGINQSFTEKAYTSKYVNLGDLSSRLGSHDVLVSAKSGEHTDVLKRTTSVIESRIRQTAQSVETVTDGTSLADKAGTELLFADASRGKYYQHVRGLQYTNGGRADQVTAGIVSRQLLTNYFGVTESSSSDLTAYAGSNGLIALLPYSGGELGLTAKIASADPELVDGYALSSTFRQILDSKKSTNEEIAQALLGLAALGEPVLIPLQNLAGLEQQSVTTRLYTAMALAEIGDREKARDIFVELLREYGEETDAYVRLKLPSDAETLEMTALGTVLAAMIQDSHMDKLWTYTSTVYEKDVITSLERALYLSEVIPGLPVSDTAFELVVNGQPTVIDLSNGKTYSLRLTEGQAADAVIRSVKGSAMLTTSRSVESDGQEKDALVSLKREYRNLQGQVVTEFKEGDVIQVRVTPSFDNSAPDGAYQITDLVPSGLTLVTQPRRYSNTRNESTVLHPFSLEGQTAKFMYYNGKRMNRTFSYYLRVTSVGQYTAEPALIEYANAPSIRSFSDEQIIKITR